MHFRSSRTASTPRGPDRIESRRPELAGRVLSFFDRLATIPPQELPLRTFLVTEPDAHRRARDEADLRIVELGAERELRDAQQATRVWLTRLLSGQEVAAIRTIPAPMISLSTEDRVRIARGLDEALMAVILGTALPPEESRELLGGWADLVLRR